MENIVAFFKSRLGKIVLIIVALIIVYIIVKKQLEKRKWGGMSKVDLEKRIACDIALEKIEDIKKNDQNWIRNQNEGDEQGKQWVLNWYDENTTLSLTENQLKNRLANYDVDYVKYPEALQILPNIQKHYNLVNAYNGQC